MSRRTPSCGSADRPRRACLLATEGRLVLAGARLPAAGQGQQMIQHSAHAHAGAALGPERMLPLAERRAGDVEVRPRDTGGEVAHKETSDDRARSPLARDVVEIGDVALQTFLVLVEERQPPEPLPGPLGPREEPVREVVVAGEQPGDALP